MALEQNDLISRLLDTNGDGTGTKNAIGNYATGQDFYIQPAAGQIFIITRMIISLEDESGFKAETFGKEAALTNGLTIKHKDSDETVVDFTDGVPVKTNGQIGMFCFDVDVKTWAATPTDEILLARFTFERSGKPLRLVGDDGDKLVVTLNDNMSAFIALRFLVQGHLETLE